MKHGIVMEIQAKRAYVFTNEGILIDIAAGKNMFIGQSITLPETAAGANRQKRWLVPALAAACLVLMLCTGLLLTTLVLPQAGPVYLSLDINPSVEFVLDADRSVSDVIPMNSEAWELLAQNDFKGLSYEAAIARWVALARIKMPEKIDQVLISAVLSRRDRSFADKIMDLDSSQNRKEIAELAGLKVKVIYTMDMGIKDDADANKLSFGRQMLLDKARARQPDVGVEDIRSAPLQSLVEFLLSNDSGQTLATATKPATPETSTTTDKYPTETTRQTTGAIPSSPSKPSETTAPATASTAASTPVATSKATTKATTKDTTKATTKAATDAPAGDFQLQVLGNTTGGWKLQWTISPENRSLSYYKVVISKSVSLPKYPDNGYLFALSRAQNSCYVTNSTGYNGGDFGGYLVPGQTYYVGITYVFSDGKSYSNTLQVAYNGPAKTASTTAASTTTAATAFSPRLAATSNNGSGISLSWDISPADRALNYYKVVISKSVSAPMYPDNGYLYALARGTTTCMVNNETAYNGGDVGDILIPGTTYRFAITYVFSDGTRVSSNVLTLTYNGPAAY